MSKIEKQAAAIGDPKPFLNFLSKEGGDPRLLANAQNLLDSNQQPPGVLTFFPERQAKHLSLSALLFYLQTVIQKSNQHKHYLR